jgi:predicted transcriptional regulator
MLRSDTGGAFMRTVGDVMDPHVFWLPTDMPLARAAQELAARQISGAAACLPDGKIVGVITLTDLTENYGGANESRLVRDVMTPEVLTVGQSEPLDRAIRLMAFEGVHRLVVLDDDEHLAGMLTSMDVLRELAGFPRQPPRAFAVAPPT